MCCFCRVESPKMTKEMVHVTPFYPRRQHTLRYEPLPNHFLFSLHQKAFASELLFIRTVGGRKKLQTM
uniref:Uncharacterized protein n=1 Tax=Anguilla anguilla TaxID=7936 RepID=A0A0E9WGI0_ANGAN